MDEILKTKNKYIMLNALELSELLIERSTSNERSLKEQNQQLAEDEKKIEELTNTYIGLKTKLSIESELIVAKSNELAKHTEDLKEVETKVNKILMENNELETKRNHLRIKKPNLKDQQIIDLGRKKLNLYKEVTGIRWDYSIIKEVAKGFVTNKKDYIHTFCFDNKQDSKQVNHLLWEEIYLCTKGKKLSQDDEGKENATPNI